MLALTAAGFDPGAISPTSGLKEKDVTLRIAKAIRERYPHLKLIATAPVKPKIPPMPRHCNLHMF